MSNESDIIQKLISENHQTPTDVLNSPTFNTILTKLQNGELSATKMKDAATNEAKALGFDLDNTSNDQKELPKVNIQKKAGDPLTALYLRKMADYSDEHNANIPLFPENFASVIRKLHTGEIKASDIDTCVKECATAFMTGQQIPRCDRETTVKLMRVMADFMENPIRNN